MEYDERMLTTYEERIEKVKEAYRKSSIYALLGSYASAEYYIIEYLSGRKVTKSKAVLGVSIDREKIFFSALEEHSPVLRQMLREKSEAELYNLLEFLKEELNDAKTEEEKEEIQFRIHLWGDIF